MNTNLISPVTWRYQALSFRLRAGPAAAGLLACFYTTAQAQSVPALALHGVTIKPYATDQLDVGGFANAGPAHPGTGARAARLRNGVRIDIHKQVEIGAIWDFGPAPAGPMRLFEGQVSYTGLRHFVFTAGIFKPSFGLESMAAQGDTVFVERSSISTITRNLATGIEREAVQAESYGRRYHIAVSATAGTAGPGVDGNQRAMAFRVVGLPVRTRSLLLHLGFSGEWIFHPASAHGAGPGLALSDNPELNPGTVSRYLNTGRIAVDAGGAFGVEGALSWRRLLVQAEGYDIMLHTRAPQYSHQPHFHGWYGMLAYTLNGRGRQWKGRSAAFSSPTCNTAQTVMCNGYGVLEVAARYSQADLQSVGIQGGNQHTAALALNWWPTAIMRVTIQYEYGQIRDGRIPEHFHGIMSLFQIKF
ncbi:porin O/P phosphate-selective [Komagataeibacter medellinensis NBRC 3288]|uniref:Porin O/P phosphate-selective n=1 Tax=Komagataeibacter medellinensis (strain NBRC 3288 / BCRC 11682 / LMG 1693 / Kondo 51) TaxID=634177 RepID=G2I2G2_KOMMN|nr:porin O/P phosphate-selective [Komagataeibacter medellinensis NBRC 3288]